MTWSKGALCLAALVMGGCSDKALPGRMLGTYKVTGALQTNTCGAGLMAPSPWTFSAEISQNGQTLYWSFMDGSVPLSGVLTAQATASLKMTQLENVDPTDAGAGPCNLQRTDDLELSFATGSPPPSFTGSIGYSFVVPVGSDCSDQASAQGGMYDTFPCAVSYTASATRR